MILFVISILLTQANDREAMLYYNTNCVDAPKNPPSADLRMTSACVQARKSSEDTGNKYVEAANAEQKSPNKSAHAKTIRAYEENFDAHCNELRVCGTHFFRPGDERAIKCWEAFMYDSATMREVGREHPKCKSSKGVS